MQGAVFLRVGSSRICSDLSSGSCSFTRSAYKSFVTTSIFSMGITCLKRSKVCCSKERPVPKKSRNCFGSVLRLNGQKRLPIPPPIITQKLSLLVTMLLILKVSANVLHILQTRNDSNKFYPFFLLFSGKVLQVWKKAVSLHRI